MQSNVMPDCARWLTVRDATAIYGLSRASWWRLTNAGKIASAKFGTRCRRLDRQSIDEYFAAHTEQREAA